MAEQQSKRPLEAEEAPGKVDQGSKLSSLANQIEYFEQIVEESEASPPAAKKPSLGVHSLTRNTTHRKIR
jgi:hypothetical protein